MARGWDGTCGSGSSTSSGGPKRSRLVAERRTQNAPGARVMQITHKGVGAGDIKGSSGSQAALNGRPGTIPLPSRIVTSLLAACEGNFSTAPEGQCTSMSAVFSAPRPKCKRGSFDDM